jgi:inhibitor of KinA
LSRFEITYKSFGERSILVEWPSRIDKDILSDVIRFKIILQNKYIEEKVYIKSAYNSLLITYELTINNIYSKISLLKEYYSVRVSINKSTFKLWKIPVCYDDDFGIDLNELSKKIGLSKSEIIRLHTKPNYILFFIGFLPGFLYLGGLDKKLHFPRRETPRLSVPQGAVAIGGKQTGIYPNVSPGGWNIIGNSPINFFDISKEVPCFAKSGDKISFYQVSRREYNDIKTLVDAGVYQIESEVIDD